MCVSQLSLIKPTFRVFTHVLNQMYCLLLAGVCFCSPGNALGLTTLKLSNNVFNGGLDVRAPQQGSGVLMDLSAVHATISKTSITSRTPLGAPLVRTVVSDIHVKKCAFSDLANNFGRFEGGAVHVDSSTFMDSPTPLEQIERWPDNNTFYQDQENFYRSEGHMFVNGTTFLRCYHPTAGGGAIRHEGPHGYVGLTHCVFDACWSKSGYGAAIFSHSTVGDRGSFTFNYNVVCNMKTDYSTIHMQCGKKEEGKQPSQYADLTLIGNVFENITITPFYEPEAGGCGLVIRFADVVKFADCHFSNCSVKTQDPHKFPSIGGAIYILENLTRPEVQGPTRPPSITLEDCTFTSTVSYEYGGVFVVMVPTVKFEMTNCRCELSNEEGQQTKYGGFLYFGDTVDNITIKGTVFDQGIANEGGCLYTNRAVAKFNMEDCIISACEARDPGSHSLVVDSPAFVVKNVSFLNMPDGRGRIKLSNSGFSKNSLTLYNCTFEQYGTGKLVEWKSEVPITFKVSLCNFISVTVLEDSLFFLDSNITEFTLYECDFENIKTNNSDVHILDSEGVATVTLHWTNFMRSAIEGSLVRVNGVTENLVIKNCEFVYCSSTSHPLIDVSQSSKLQLYDVNFENCTVPEKNSLINLVSVEELTLGPYAYFRGAKEQAGTAAYIKSDKGNVVIELPVCFDLEAEFSVDFAGTKPWESIENGTGIFECYDAPETPTPSPTPTPTPTEATAKKGLTSGAIAGLVIGLLVVMAVLLVVILFLVIRRRRMESSTEEDDVTKHDDTETVTQETLQTADFMDDDNFKVTEDNPVFRSEVFGEANDFTNEFEEHSV